MAGRGSRENGGIEVRQVRRLKVRKVRVETLALEQEYSSAHVHVFVVVPPANGKPEGAGRNEG